MIGDEATTRSAIESVDIIPGIGHRLWAVTYRVHRFVWVFLALCGSLLIGGGISLLIPSTTDPIGYNLSIEAIKAAFPFTSGDCGRQSSNKTLEDYLTQARRPFRGQTPTESLDRLSSSDEFPWLVIIVAEREYILETNDSISFQTTISAATLITDRVLLGTAQSCIRTKRYQRVFAVPSYKGPDLLRHATKSNQVRSFEENFIEKLKIGIQIDHCRSAFGYREATRASDLAVFHLTRSFGSLPLFETDTSVAANQTEKNKKKKKKTILLNTICLFPLEEIALRPSFYPAYNSRLDVLWALFRLDEAARRRPCGRPDELGRNYILTEPDHVYYCRDPAVEPLEFVCEIGGSVGFPEPIITSNGTEREIRWIASALPAFPLSIYDNENCSTAATFLFTNLHSHRNFIIDEVNRTIGED